MTLINAVPASLNEGVIQGERDSSLNQWSRMPLRIGLLMDHPSPHMTALLEAIAGRTDCTLEVLYCGRSAPERNWGSAAGRIPHAFLGGITGPLGIRFNPGIFKAMRQLRVDVWVVNTVYTSLTTWMAAAWLRYTGKTWAYMNEPVRPRPKAYSFLKEIPLNFILTKTKGVIATGAVAREMYEQRVPPTCRCVSIPYFLDLSEFLNLTCPAVPAEHEDLQFVTSSQMIPRKGLDCLLQACEELPDAGWHLTLIGDGPSRTKLEREFAPLIRCGKVSFAGAVPYHGRAEAFSGRHVFVFPSRWDGWGMVVPEALAAGLPVISSDQVMSAHEFITNGENGFILPAGNARAITEKMRWFLQNRSACARMSKAARRSVEKYRSDLGAETLIEYLRKLGSGSFQERDIAARPLALENHTWRVLTSPQSPVDHAMQFMRSTAKDSVIRANLALRRPRRASGHLILGYHLVLKEDRANFEDQIKFFRDHFRICSMADLLSYVNSGNQDECRLAITFDDGFRILLQDCLELLEKYEIKAGFFVPSAFVASGLSPARRSVEFSRRAFYYNHPLEPMHPQDLRDLTRMGHEVGSHGLFHTSIHSILPEAAQKNLAASRSMIAEWTGVAPDGFCYPYGMHANAHGDPAQWLRSAGYKYGLTLTRGRVDTISNPFFLPRHHLEGNWPIRYLRHFLLA